jgi:CheY-like chemotaxis protein
MDKSISVLVVDDDQQIINLLIHALKRNLGNNVRVIIARDESSAIHSEMVDIVLVEFSLPTRSFKEDNIRTKALEVIKQLKNKNPHTVIIAMSSYSKKGNELMAAGADYFIPDTYDQGQLSTLLREITK